MVKHVPGSGGGGTVDFDPIEVRPDTGGGGWNPGPGREPRQDPDPGHEAPPRGGGGGGNPRKRPRRRIMTIINPQDMTKTYRIVLPDGTPDTVTIEKFEVLGRSARIWFKVGAGWAFTVMGSILPGKAGSVLARNGADVMEILLGPEPIRATDSMGNVYVIQTNGLQVTTTPDGQEFIIDAWERELPPVVATPPDVPPTPDPVPPQPMPEPAPVPPMPEPVPPQPMPEPEIPPAPPVVVDPAPPTPEPPVQLPPRFEEDPERRDRGGLFPRRPRQRE